MRETSAGVSGDDAESTHKSSTDYQLFKSESGSPSPVVQGTSSQELNRASSTSRPDDLPDQENQVEPKRFSILRFRNASDSQLSLRMKQTAENIPPLPQRKSLPLAESILRRSVEEI